MFSNKQWFHGENKGKQSHCATFKGPLTSYSLRRPSQSFCLRDMTYCSRSSILMERSTSGWTTRGKGFFSSGGGGGPDESVSVSATEDGVFSEADPSTTPLSFRSELELSSGISTVRREGRHQHIVLIHFPNSTIPCSPTYLSEYNVQLSAQEA